MVARETEIRSQADAVSISQNTFLHYFHILLGHKYLCDRICTTIIIIIETLWGFARPVARRLNAHTRNTIPPTSRCQLKAHVYNASRRGRRGPTKVRSNRSREHQVCVRRGGTRASRWERPSDLWPRIIIRPARITDVPDPFVLLEQTLITKMRRWAKSLSLTIIDSPNEYIYTYEIVLKWNRI